MVFHNIKNLRRGFVKRCPHNQDDIIDGLLKTREIHCIQTVDYNGSLVRSIDIDPTNNL